jgi:hypothetical protein
MWVTRIAMKLVSLAMWDRRGWLGFLHCEYYESNGTEQGDCRHYKGYKATVQRAGCRYLYLLNNTLVCLHSIFTGNTCFMNSSLACIRFLSSRYCLLCYFIWQHSLYNFCGPWKRLRILIFCMMLHNSNCDLAYRCYWLCSLRSVFIPSMIAMVSHFVFTSLIITVVIRIDISGAAPLLLWL